MKVQALEMGFFGGQRIRAGQQFEVPDGTKAVWFFTVEADSKAAKPSLPAAKKEKPVALSELNKATGKSFVEANAKVDQTDANALA